LLSEKMISEKAIESVLLNSQFPIPEKLFDAVFNKFSIKRIKETLPLIPLAEYRSRIVDIGCYAPMISLYHELLGYREVIAISNYDWTLLSEKNVLGRKKNLKLQIVIENVEQKKLPIESESVDVVLLLEVMEHFSRDPFFVLSEINRVLKTDGFLVLSTPNCISSSCFFSYLLGKNPFPEPYNGIDGNRHNRLYSPKEIFDLASAAGFSVERIITTSFPRRLGGSLANYFVKLIDNLLFYRKKKFSILRGDIIQARLRKTGPVNNRFPDWLYISRSIWQEWYQYMDKL